MKRALVITLLVLVAACREEPRDVSYAEEIRLWQRNRATRLQAEDSWLSLVGLFWLDPGRNTFGSAPTNKIVMPAKAPAKLGTLMLEDGVVTLIPDPSAGLTIDGKPVTTAVQLENDTSDKGPTVLSVGSMRFYAIKRGGNRYGIRVKDPEAETRTHFRGLESYPISDKWRVVAQYEPYNPPKKIPITDITGVTSDETAPGALVFTIDGTRYRIDPIVEQGESDFFLIFKDETSRDMTYPAGRYLYASPPGPDGRVIIDFNKAYNPPCAFTPFATCPLPPIQNRLPVRIEAGEKRYKGGHA